LATLVHVEDQATLVLVEDLATLVLVEDLATLAHVEDLVTPAPAVVLAILARRTRCLRDVVKYPDKHAVPSQHKPARRFPNRNVDQYPDKLKQLSTKMCVNQFQDNSASRFPRQCLHRSVNKYLASSADGW